LQVTAAKQGNIGFLDAVMGFYRVHAGGRWSGLGSVRKLQDALKFFLALRDQIPSGYWNKFVRPKVADYRMRLSAELAGQGDTAGARREAWASLRTDPRVALSSPRKFIRAFVPSS
jgi:hypothetical protein